MTKQMNIKDVIYVALILISGLSSYFTLKGNVDVNSDKIIEHEIILKENNLELLTYKIDELDKKMGNFIDMFSNYIELSK